MRSYIIYKSESGVIKKSFSWSLELVFWRCVCIASFTDLEYCKMMLIYGGCQRNPTSAASDCAVSFPDGPLPSVVTIANEVRRLRETGSTRSRQRSGRPMSAGMRIAPESILVYTLIHPHSSTRHISMACGLVLPKYSKYSKMHILIACHSGLQ